MRFSPPQFGLCPAQIANFWEQERLAEAKLGISALSPRRTLPYFYPLVNFHPLVMRYVPDPKPSSGSRQGLLLLAILLLGLGVGLVTEWLRQRWTAWRAEVNRVPPFEDLPPERQQKVLRDPQLWHLKYRLAIQAGELKVKKTSVLSPSASMTAGRLSLGRKSFSISNVDRSEIAPIKAWVQKNVPASEAPIHLTLEVRQPHLGPEFVRSRIYRIDPQSIVEEFPENDHLGNKLLMAFEDGELPISKGISLGSLNGRADAYAVVAEVGKDAPVIAEWVRKNLPEDQPKILLQFLVDERAFEITREAAKEISYVPMLIAPK